MPLPARARCGQTDTDWGRIWDGLPKGFPRSRARRGESRDRAGIGHLVVQGATRRHRNLLPDARCSAPGTRRRLVRPLEDGGYVLDMTGPAGLQGPGDGQADGRRDTVTILYGAACPHD